METLVLTIKERMPSRDQLISLASIMGLILVTLVFAVLTDGKSISPINLKILTNQIVVTALVAIGMVFSFASGALDMSAGGSLGISAIVGGIVGLHTGSIFWMIVAIVLVSMGVAAIKGFVAAYLTLPVFIVTIIFGSFLSAVGLVLLGDQTTLSLSSLISIRNMTWINGLFLAGFFIIALIVFNYTKIGKAAKLQGGNPLASAQSGISSKKTIIYSFLMSGMGITLAAIITILKTKTVTAQTGITIGNDILVAIVLGGMPLSGGPRSKIGAALIGSATITILNNGLSIMNVSNDDIQIVRGLIFLAVVFLTSMSYRTKYLPR